MPVYNWESMKAEQYLQWIRRIAKNIKLYDLIRLDHFRAFAEYWEVPSASETAKNGAWKSGPGADSIHAPHNMSSDNCVAYTGTRDNNTTRGCYEEEADTSTKIRLEQYIGRNIKKNSVVETLIRLAYASTVKRVIVPAQDLLNKGSRARMNTPASLKGNWIWRLKPKDFDQKIQEKLLTFTKLYGRQKGVKKSLRRLGLRLNSKILRLIYSAAA